MSEPGQTVGAILTAITEHLERATPEERAATAAAIAGAVAGYLSTRYPRCAEAAVAAPEPAAEPLTTAERSARYRAKLRGHHATNGHGNGAGYDAVHTEFPSRPVTEFVTFRDELAHSIFLKAKELQETTGKDKYIGEVRHEPSRDAVTETLDAGRNTPDAAQQKDEARDTARRIHEEARTLLDFLNEKAGRRFRPVPATLKLIEARLRTGATVADCRGVIARQCREWRGDHVMAKYLRPETLFNATKFESYVGLQGTE